MHSTHCFVDTEYEILIKFQIRHDGVLPIESEMKIDQSGVEVLNEDLMRELRKRFRGHAIAIKRLPAKHTNFFCATHIIYGVSGSSIYLEFVGDEENLEFLVDDREMDYTREYVFGFNAKIKTIKATQINGKYYYERKNGVLCPIKEIEPIVETEPS